MNKQIQPDEKILVGDWIVTNGKVVGNDLTNRIEYLIQEHLIELDSNSENWEILYQDPSDKRFWILYYPQSEMHGGGPPALKNISIKEASEKFKYS